MFFCFDEVGLFLQRLGVNCAKSRQSLVLKLLGFYS
ncbi:hypothetical protein BAZSYMB_SCAFFOLD00064_3 [Bathymodiolus azoricus thioautotrophic gill symbiont]|uniref:Uncharacterized protein n=1 Tax=Bathymodiolus azoricus thioautotrophic gill symbiont TaxID=235205 RepID=A0A1H6MB28_9GAMM|nr:hypothetical protein BAZSYMB_SCAFFOLD00064_3 [Bathymodiolus azoricus thioautotrophic gill symbiont]SEH96219.1 hypothetical protein BAZSYMA_ACONTIG02045_0 [Bathymodiolus azoricus thioautotrophic gill symbiont]